ncbi:MAG: dynamin family protein, partial [Alphaproteobacteria bacterium]|nr:dynamin family protein [Alphaproteobacteria bacterium]
MKNVSIKYNPYLLKTEIKIDGEEPKSNSSLNFGKQRLQEWAEKFVAIFLDEYRDANVKIEFTGSLADYNDLKETIESSSDTIHVATWNHNCVQDVEEVEKEVISIFNEIQKGPVEALKDTEIIKSFKRATSEQFCINVVATMSAGKSTLINALLGKKLMPMASMATTATIVRIIASNQDYFSAIAFDKNDEQIAEDENITYETMKIWNTDERISSINIYGPIPCVDNVGMRLVLVDTPGPNNSRDEQHKAMTYDMLESSEKSLVLFVVNATTEGTDDESALMDFVSDCMKNGGKQSRD